MNTSIVISQDTRKAKRDGSFPLILRITHKRKTISVPLGISMEAKYWDGKNRRVRNSYNGVSSVTRLNNQLEKRKTKALDIIYALAEKDELKHYTALQLKQKIVRDEEVVTLEGFTQTLLGELEHQGRFGTIRWYKDCLRAVALFTKDVDVEFQEITYNWLVDFEHFYIARGNSYNSLSAYLRGIRAIYNKGIRQGVIEKGLYPFDTYTIKHEKTRKRAISVEAIKRIVTLSLNPDHSLYHVRNYFLASYLLNGMNFTDLAYLKLDNIVDGRVQYTRQKTNRPYTIKISERLQEILSHYSTGKSLGDFVFPIIKRSTPREQYLDIQSAVGYYNKGLKELAKLCEIEENLTSYVSRHSFATEALMQDVPLSAISTMLGHNSISTTEVYLKSLPNAVIDDYAERLRL